MKLWDLVSAGLTKREQQIAYAVLAGLSGREISKTLGIPERTVKQNLHKMFLKFELDPAKSLTVQLAVKLYECSR